MLLALTLAACPVLCQGTTDPRFVEHLIAEMPAGIELAAEAPGEMPIAVRTSRSVGFDAGESHRVGWTGDGRSVAYVGQRGAELVPVFGDRVGEVYRDVFAPTVSRSCTAWNAVVRADHARDPSTLAALRAQLCRDPVGAQQIEALIERKRKRYAECAWYFGDWAVIETPQGHRLRVECRGVS